jgi:nucleoside-diphosphate-sugar epimerase
MPAVPRLGFSFVDVRDVADLHVRAMEQPKAGGGRYIATDRFMWTADVGRVLRDRLGERARKVPTRTAPNLMVRAMALFDPGIRTIVGDLGRHSEYSSARAREELGWSTRPLEDSIAETGESLIEHGVVAV